MERIAIERRGLAHVLCWLIPVLVVGGSADPAFAQWTDAGSYMWTNDSLNVGVSSGIAPAKKVELHDPNGDVLRLRRSNATARLWDLNITSSGNLVVRDSTAGLDRLAINTTGLVGIGTTLPSAKLHVAGGAIQLDTSQELRFGGANTAINGGAALSLKTGGVNRLWIDGTGSVGVGTTAPTSGYIFDVNGLANFRSYARIQANLDVLGTNGVYVPNGWTQAKYFLDADNTSYFLDPANTVTSAAVAGKVGIGSTAPAGRLHVDSALNTSGTVFNLPSISSLPDPSYTHKEVMLWQGGETKFGKWRNYFNGWEQDWALTYNAPWDYTNNTWLGRDSGDSRANIASYMRFNVAEGDSGANTFEVTFAPPGNSGTVPDWNAASQYWFYDGRISPSPARPARLRIRGAANMDAVLSLIGHGSVVPLSMELISDGVNKLFKIGQVDRDVAGDITAETDFIVVKTDTTNVGVGTTSPADKLQVAGDVRVGTGTTGCIKDADGTVIAGTCSSDARFKMDVTPFSNTLDKIVQLQPVNFHWRAEEYPERAFGVSASFGLVAQDVERVLPELVTEDSHGDKAVRYNKLIFLTLQAVKELKAENDALKQRLGALEQQASIVQ